jgi:hypothetical protein
MKFPSYLSRASRILQSISTTFSSSRRLAVICNPIGPFRHSSGTSRSQIQPRILSAEVLTSGIHLCIDFTSRFEVRRWQVNFGILAQTSRERSGCEIKKRLLEAICVIPPWYVFTDINAMRPGSIRSSSAVH